MERPIVCIIVRDDSEKLPGGVALEDEGDKANSTIRLSFNLRSRSSVYVLTSLVLRLQSYPPFPVPSVLSNLIVLASFV